jgi:hypothetical protein
MFTVAQAEIYARSERAGNRQNMNGTIKVPRLSDAIAERLQAMIIEGILRPGDKLIGERDLAGGLSYCEDDGEGSLRVTRSQVQRLRGWQCSREGHSVHFRLGTRKRD